jgi:hypothetical protein
MNLLQEIDFDAEYYFWSKDVLVQLQVDSVDSSKVNHCSKLEMTGAFVFTSTG